MIEQCLKEIEQSIKSINENIKSIIAELNYERDKNKKLESRITRLYKKSKK